MLGVVPHQRRDPLVTVDTERTQGMSELCHSGTGLAVCAPPATYRREGYDLGIGIGRGPVTHDRRHGQRDVHHRAAHGPTPYLHRHGISAVRSWAAKTGCPGLRDPRRSHDVPEGHFTADVSVVLLVDRLASYKAMAPVKDGLVVLAFCWAHVRRDFIAAAKSFPELKPWALGWLRLIRQAYRHNDRRLAQLNTPGLAAAWIWCGGMRERTSPFVRGL